MQSLTLSTRERSAAAISSSRAAVARIFASVCDQRTDAPPSAASRPHTPPALKNGPPRHFQRAGLSWCFIRSCVHRSLGIAVEGVLELVKAIIFLPARILRGPRRAW